MARLPIYTSASLEAIPEQLRQVFYANRHDGELLSRFMRTGYGFLEDVVSTVKRVDLKNGAIMVVQARGRLVDIILTCM